MADDDVENEFLKEEEENDPSEIQKEALKVQKEGLAFYKKILAEQQRKAEEGYMGGAPGEFLAIASSPRIPREVGFSVRKITNGYILAQVLSRGFHPIPESENAQEEYFPSIEPLIERIGKLAVEFAVSQEPQRPPQDVPDGT